MLREQHIQFGKHSKIPECCINYFVHEWDYEIERYGSAQNRDTNGPPYVRCRNYLTQDLRTPIHKCSYECKGFLESIGRTDLADEFKKPKEDSLWTSIYQPFSTDSNVVINNESLSLVAQRYWQAHTISTMAPISYSSLVDSIQPILYDPQPTPAPEQNLPSGAALRLTSEGSTSISDPFPLV